MPDFRIPLMVQPANPYAAYDLGQEHRQNMLAAQRKERAQNALAQYTPDVFSNDPAKRQQGLQGVMSADPQAGMQLLEAVNKMDDRQRAIASENAEAIGRIGMGLKNMPYEQRRQTLAQMAAQIQARGGDPSMVQNFDPTDENIGMAVSQATSLKDAIAQSNADRTYTAEREDEMAERSDRAAGRNIQERQLSLSERQAAETARHNRAAESAATAANAGGMKLTEAQSKDVGFAMRGSAASQRLDEVGRNLTLHGGAQGIRGYADSAVRGVEGVLGSIPFIGGALEGGALAQSVISAERQVAEQAALDYVMAALRKDTGAAINKEEWAMARRTWIPQPGDSDAILAQKKQSRDNQIESLRRGLGPAAALTGPLQTPGPQIPDGAISLLRSNPALAQAFDQKYGQGAAASVLGR